MSKIYPLGHLAGLRLNARASALVGFALIWIILSVFAIIFSDLSLGISILGAFLATLLHYLSELWHNLGHAFAARRTGHPMSGVTFIGALAISRYPRDEGELPARVHIQRALGGPAASFMLSALSGAAAWALSATGGLAWIFACFIFADNLLVFTLGAFLPLGFTDGSTILYWRRNN